MPLLAITTSTDLDSDAKRTVLDTIAETYAEVMDGNTDFLTVNYQAVAREDLWLGRAKSDRDVFVLEADVRAGRPLEKRREFALAVMEHVHEELSIPHPNMKVVFTEHEGSHMMGYTRVGNDWEPTTD